MSNARNLVSRVGGGGGGGGSTASISSSRVISSGFCGVGGAIDSTTLGTIALPLGASSRLSSTAASSSIVISSGLSARGGGPVLDDGGDVVVSSAGSCRTRASNRVCKCAANHHVGWRLRKRPISGGDPSRFEAMSLRRNGLRRSRPLRSPCCSIPHGQS